MSFDAKGSNDTPRGAVQRAEVAIIGAGPIGLELAVCLKRAGVNYLHFDAHQIGHTMTWWPRNTSFFSTTERLAIPGVPIQNNHQGRITSLTRVDLVVHTGYLLLHCQGHQGLGRVHAIFRLRINT